VLSEKKWHSGIGYHVPASSGDTERADYKKELGENMKPSTQDRTEGKLHEVKGKVKEEIGKAANDPDLEVSGNVEKNVGKVQNLIGRAEKALGE
jgi:uncharacterized protein YjbJ (UPF0337 family)